MPDGRSGDGVVAGEARLRRVILAWSSLVALAWLVAAIYLTQVASPPRELHRNLDDTASHVGLGVLVGGCLICVVHASGQRGRQLYNGIAAASLLAAAFLVGTELLQAQSSARQAGIGDAGADVAGVVLVAVVLLLAFAARPPMPTVVVVGFVAAASVAVAFVVATAATSSSAPEQERPRKPTITAPESTTCITRGPVVSAAPPPGGLSEPLAIEPLLRFDLASTIDGAAGGTVPVQLVPSGEVQHRPGIGAVFGDESGALTSAGPVDGLLDDLAVSQQFTIDVWLNLAHMDQTGPARIVALASGTTRAVSNFHLGVEGQQLSVRIRTACDETNWQLIGGLSTGPVHVALTFDRGNVVVYIDGAVQARYQLTGADLEDWLPSVPLTIGNEATLDRPLAGTVATLTVWPRTFTDSEIADLASDPDRREALRR